MAERDRPGRSVGNVVRLVMGRIVDEFEECELPRKMLGFAFVLIYFPLRLVRVGFCIERYPDRLGQEKKKY
jgi:hypothetical protein